MQIKQRERISLWSRKSFRKKTTNFFVYMVVLMGAVILLIPFFWMISTSLKPTNQVFVYPPTWIPRPIMWQNYAKAWQFLPIGTFFKNTFVYAGFCVVGETLISSFVAFGFARLRFRGSTILFFVLLATMMIPRQVTMIPLYVFFARLGWVNSYRPLIVPAYFGNPFLIFLLRQFFRTIPKQMDDAAKIDGCGFFGIYSRICLPIAKPALGVVAIFSFSWTWQEFMSPLIYLDDIAKFPIALGLRAFQTSTGRIDWTSLMAVSTLAMIPVLALFFIAQKYYIQGITLSGVKG